VALGAGLADEPGDRAIGADEAEFGGGGFAVAHGFAPRGGHAGAVVGMEGQFPTVAEGLLGREAGDLAPAAVDEGGAAGGIGAENADGRHFGEDAEALFALAEGSFGGEALGDVAKTPDTAGGTVGDDLGVGVAFEDAAIAAVEHIEDFFVGAGVEVAEGGEEAFGRDELIEDLADQRGLVVGGKRGAGIEAPHLGEIAVEGVDAAAGVDDEDAVGGGLEGGAHEREGAVAGGFGEFARGDIEDGGEAVGLAGERDEAAAPEDEEGLAVFAAHLGFEFVGVAVSLELGDVGVAVGGVDPDVELAGGAADDFFAGEAEETEGGGIQFGDGAGREGKETNPNRTAVEKCAETLLAFAKGGGAEFGVTQSLFEEAGVMKDERGHAGEEEAFLHVFGGKGSVGFFAGRAQNADTPVSAHDGKDGEGVDAAGAVDAAGVGIGGVVVDDNGREGIDGAPGDGAIGAAHAVAEEVVAAGGKGADDEVVVFEEGNLDVGRTQEGRGAGGESLEEFGDVATADEFEGGLVEGCEKLDLAAHGVFGFVAGGDIGDDAVPDDAAVVGAAGLGAEADPAQGAIGIPDASIVAEGGEIALRDVARGSHRRDVIGMEAGIQPRDADGESRGEGAEKKRGAATEIGDDLVALGGDDKLVERALGEIFGEELKVAVARPGGLGAGRRRRG